MGFTQAARIAGASAARIATDKSVSVTVTNVDGSRGCTRNRNPASSFVPKGIKRKSSPNPAMSECTRREFAQSVIKSLTMYAFVGAAISSHATEISFSQETKSWSDQINEISFDLRSRKLSPVEWQVRIEEVFGSIDLPELLTHVEFSKLQRSFDVAENGVNSMKVDFRKVPGMPHDISYTTFIFGMQEGRSIVPHGHHYLVSGHLVIEGNLHVRNFERLRDDDDSVIIRPTVDRTISVRDCSIENDHVAAIFYDLRRHDFSAVESTLRGRMGEPTEEKIDGYSGHDGCKGKEIHWSNDVSDIVLIDQCEHDKYGETAVNLFYTRRADLIAKPAH
jgi:hypothetical protein